MRATTTALILLVFGFGLGAAHAQDSTTPQASTRITPAHVLAKVRQLAADVELVRLEMGRPRSSGYPLRIEAAAPREVYFQALNLFEKSARLSFEQTRQRSSPPRPADPGKIAPSDVFSVVAHAMAEVRSVKRALQISESSSEPPIESGITPSDVFVAVGQLNRQLNLLLDSEFSPSDVFMQVNACVRTTAGLLARFPGVRRVWPDPALQRRKRPRDVYVRLVAAFNMTRTIAQGSNLQVLRLEVDEDSLGLIAPSDAYDMASLLLSELAYFGSISPRMIPAPEAYYPGRKLPSQVFQRAGVLISQLDRLAGEVKTNPGWLKQ